MYSVTTHEQAHKLNPTVFVAPGKPPRVTFGLQVGDSLEPTDHGAYFTTSTRRNRSDKRTYQVRFVDGATGRVVMVMDHHQTNYGARLAAKTLAVRYQHGCQLCRNVGHSPAEACAS